MIQSDFRLPAADGAALFVRTFLPAGGNPRALLQIAHGMAEHSARYARFARVLTEHGYGAYVDDHRGHGQTASGREALGHFADEGGWSKVVSDHIALFREIKSRHPDAPVFLMGHSMGSYIVRNAAPRLAPELAGLILSATTHGSLPRLWSTRLLAMAERKRLGRHGKSMLLRIFTFDSFNNTIEDPRTTCDWLSRDPFEVDKYLADPLCGFECTTQLFCDVFEGMVEMCKPGALEKLPKSLPVYIMAGERDPLNNRLAAIKRLHRALENAGLREITLRVYPDARHELLNETNRDEVTRDLIQWLDERLAARAA